MRIKVLLRAPQGKHLVSWPHPSPGIKMPLHREFLRYTVRRSQEWNGRVGCSSSSRFKQRFFLVAPGPQALEILANVISRKRRDFLQILERTEVRRPDPRRFKAFPVERRGIVSVLKYLRDCQPLRVLNFTEGHSFQVP